jgi:hypothetical protein
MHRQVDKAIDSQRRGDRSAIHRQEDDAIHASIAKRVKQPILSTQTLGDSRGLSTL